VRTQQDSSNLAVRFARRQSAAEIGGARGRKGIGE